MAFYHNNMSTLVGFDPGNANHVAPYMSNVALQPDGGIFGTLYNHEPSSNGFGADVQEELEWADRHFIPSFGLDPSIKLEDQDPELVAQVKEESRLSNVSQSPSEESNYEEAPKKRRRSPNLRKLNKGGEPRKPRRPRSKLLKWDDNDWRNVVLGLIWACGDVGLQIPFEQAAQIVDPSCSAGALQQAVLKLRNKQIDEGHKVPQLKMTWTRKNKSGNSLSSVANGDLSQEYHNKFIHKKKASTHADSTQSLIVKLRYNRAKGANGKFHDIVEQRQPMPRRPTLSERFAHDVGVDSDKHEQGEDNIGDSACYGDYTNSRYYNGLLGRAGNNDHDIHNLSFMSSPDYQLIFAHDPPIIAQNYTSPVDASTANTPANPSVNASTEKEVSLNATSEPISFSGLPRERVYTMDWDEVIVRDPTPFFSYDVNGNEGAFPPHQN